ncbi:MAG TPA: PQQ-dependent dehydrogenase, methanol/ethanol family [Gemmatimonadales bacterium]|nr:PQQ-dependent dehydrogenase, methanol/ethanol family [Gemmatimonadales bacterium]
MALGCDRGPDPGRTPDARDAEAADSALARAMADSGGWPSYGRDYTNRRFSPLGQITARNVAGLRLAWRYKTGLPYGFEASPLVVDGVMYVSTPLNHVVALDAATGRKRWEYVHRLGTTVHCCGPVNRGVAYYGGRVYMGTLDGKLVALDAGDGEKVWEVQVGDNRRGYAVNGPPVAADGKVLIGVSGAEYGIRGYLTAYDAATGRQVWRFYTIPSPEEGGWWGRWARTDPFGTDLHRDIARERADSAKYQDAWQTGGGSVWQAPAIDTRLGLVIFTVGNPSPDLNGAVRPGDNLYTNSVVAVDLETGRYRWHFQTIPHDVWDLDAASPPVLVDVMGEDGRAVPAVAHAGKTGWVYVVDRGTGKPIRRSEPFVPHDNLFAQPTPEGTRMLPGANGGSEWSPTAFHPETGYLYVLGLHQPMLYKVRDEPFRPPEMWLGGAFVGTGEPEYGLFSAVDLNSGRVVWQHKVADPMIGGALATAGGVVFTGTKDRQVLALDARSGRVLWRHEAAGGVNAPPISYAVNGRQFVAVAAGGNFQINAPRSDELLAFALDAGTPPAAPRPEGGGP